MPDNFIQPGKLVLDGDRQHFSPNPPSTSSFDLTDLKVIISEIVRKESREIVDSIVNPAIDINSDVDQTIDVGPDRNLSDMDRIPDVVKSLREFSGQPGEFSSWKKSVDRILRIYEHLKGTPKYYGILSVIRNKITGCADIALESYNTPLNWEKIAKCLTLHYADKRDLGTLEYQMTTLVQRNNTIPEFYQEVYFHLSLILNKLSCMEMSQESLDIMTQSYRDRALDTFVRGLKGDLPRLLSMKEPIDLPQALHLCLKLENVNYRVQHSHGVIRGTQQRTVPPIPPRNNFYSQRSNPMLIPRRNFYPELVNNPQKPPKPNFSGHFQSPQQVQRQQFNNHHPIFPKPEPIEIDHTLRSRAINYQNRPQTRQFVNKRPSSHQMYQPNKSQRIFHTEPAADEHNDLEQYGQEISSQDENFDQTLIDYIDSQDNPTLEQTDDLDDIDFLV